MSEIAKEDRCCPLCRGNRLMIRHTVSCCEESWSLARCLNCRLKFTLPKPTEAWISRFYSRDYHQHLCVPGASERAFGAKYSRYIKWISSFDIRGRVLDIGCATGLFPKMLAEQGFDAKGVELNREVADWGSQHYCVDIETCPLEKCSYAPESFDLVTMTDVLEHTENPVLFLRRVRRL